MITILAATDGALDVVEKLDKNKYEFLLFRTCLNAPSIYRQYDLILIGNNYIVDDTIEYGMEIGNKAIHDSIDDIIKRITTDKVVVLGFSGGTMSGGIPFMVEKLIEIGKEVYVIATIPCEWEGPERNKNTEIYLEELSKITTNLYIVNHRKIFEELKKELGKNNVSIMNIFRKCDDIVIDKIKELEEKGWR